MIRRVAFVRRKPGMTVDDFWAHYSGPHAEIVQRMPGLRRMLLSRPVGPQSSEWDAIGELWFDTRPALDHAFGDPAIAGLLQADRPQFLGDVEVMIVEDAFTWLGTGA